MSQPTSAAPSRKKTTLSLLVLAALTGIIVLLFKDNWAEITAALSQLSAWLPGCLGPECVRCGCVF